MSHFSLSGLTKLILLYISRYFHMIFFFLIFVVITKKQMLTENVNSLSSRFSWLIHSSVPPPGTRVRLNRCGILLSPMEHRLALCIWPPHEVLTELILSRILCTGSIVKSCIGILQHRECALKGAKLGAFAHLSVSGSLLVRLDTHLKEPSLSSSTSHESCPKSLSQTLNQS